MNQNRNRIEINQLYYLLDRLSDSSFVDLENNDLFIFGGGGQSRDFYRNLSKNKDLEVLWSGWPAPKWTKIFSFIPGQGGLIKIKNNKIVKSLFEELAVLSVSTLFYLPKRTSKNLKIDRYRNNLKSLINENNEGFWFEVEMDETIEIKYKDYFHYDYFTSNGLDPEIKNWIEGKVNAT